MNRNMFTRNGVWAIISRTKIKEVLQRFKSLRVLIFLAIVLSVFSVCYSLTYGILTNYEKRAVSLRTSDIKTQCETIINQIGISAYLQDPSSEVINAQFVQLANFYDGRVVVVDENFIIVKDTFALATGKTMVSSDIIEAFRGKEQSRYDSENDYIQQVVAIEDAVSKDVIGAVLITTSTKSIVDSLDILQQKAYVLIILLMILVIVVAFFVSQQMVKPFAKMGDSMKEFSEGFIDDGEIHLSSYKEMDLLSESIKFTINRMKVLDEGRKEFVSNVSHELKTPITSIKVLADSLLMQENAPAELYREFMADIVDEIDRESKIIDDLLSLVKLDKTSNDLNIASVDINEFLELTLKRLQPIAAKRNIELLLECFRSVRAEVDEVKLTLAISNLVENAIKYNVDNGWVHVSLNADHKFFYVTVSDSGVGIPKEDQSYIFERFYRVDKSHSREIGGTGLGLAITRNAILLHRGTIQVFSEEGKGTTFTVRIPLIYIV